MNELSRPRRPHGTGVYLLVIGASLVLGGLAGGASAIIGDQPGPVGTAVTAALVTAAMAVGFTACLCGGAALMKPPARLTNGPGGGVVRAA